MIVSPSCRYTVADDSICLSHNLRINSQMNYLPVLYLTATTKYIHVDISYTHAVLDTYTREVSYT